jgi:beta-lactamase regulating signal transducer with metallopeptidase domain
VVEPLRAVLSSGLVDRVGWTLLHSLWEAAAVAILVAGGLRAMNGFSAATRYVVASAGLGMMVMLVVGTFFFITGTGRVTSREAVGVGGGERRFATEPQRDEGRTENAGGAVRTLNVATVTQTVKIPLRERLAEMARELEPVFPWMVGIWTFGVLMLSGWQVGGWMAMQRLRRVGVESAGERVEAMVVRMRKRLAVSRTVRVMGSGLVSVPMVMGHFRPLILVPMGLLAGLPVEQVEAIVAHELAHVRRHDYVVNLVQIIVETLLFYHPAVWWISKQIRREREHCCDDLAAEVVGDRVVYAEALVSVASLRKTGNGLAMAANGGTMLVRIQRVLGVSGRERSRRPASLAAIVAAVVLVMLPLMNVHPTARAQSAATEPADGKNGVTVIHGKVLETGTEKPVAGARVDLHGGSESVSFTTDSAGEFTCHVPTGTWQFEFGEVPRNYYLTAGPDDQGRQMEVAADATIREKTVTLHIPPLLPIGAIHGKVVMPDGSPAAGILMVPVAEVPDGPQTIGGLIYLNAKNADAEGRFTFATAPAGSPVNLYADTADHTLAFAAEVQTKARMVDQDVGTFTLQPTATSDVLIKDAHGQPLANMSMNVSPTFGDHGLGNKNRRFTTDDRGHLMADGLVPGLHYKVSQRGKKYHVNVVLVDTAKEAAEVMLDENFVMRVVDSAGKAVPVSDILSITVTMDDKMQWNLGPKPEIVARVAEEGVLIDPQQVVLAHAGNLVTMRFKSSHDVAMVATGIFDDDMSGMRLTALTSAAPAFTVSAAPGVIAADEYGGRVLDAAGHPVAGAVISVPDFGMPFVLGKMKTVATTDEMGSFRISTKGQRFFYLQIDKEGFARQWLLGSSLPKGEAIDVKLNNSTRLKMDLRLADGTPAAGAVLTAVTNLEDVSSGMTHRNFRDRAIADAAGHLDMALTPGIWELRVQYKDAAFARLLDVEIAPGRAVEKQVTLTPGVDLKIRAVDSVTGKPIVGATLAMEENFPGMTGFAPDSQRTTDSEGRAEWPSVMPGQQSIWCSAEGYARYFCEDASWVDRRGIDAIPLNLVAAMHEVKVLMEAGMRLTGKVVDSAGKPLANVFVNVFGLDTGDDRYKRPTNAQGAFSLVVPTSNGYQQSNYRLGVVTSSDPYHAKVLTEEFTPVIGGEKAFVLVLPGSP